MAKKKAKAKKNKKKQKYPMLNSGQSENTGIVEDESKGTCAADECPVAKGLRMCTGCREVKYCSVNCQKSHWKAHKSYCREVRRRKKEKEKENRAKNVPPPFGLPKLYPGPPPFAYDLSSIEGEFGGLCRAARLPVHMLQMVMGNYVQQRKLDDRWKYVSMKYDGIAGGKTKLRTLNEHKKLFEESGLDFSHFYNLMSGEEQNKEMDFNEIGMAYMQSGIIPLDDYENEWGKEFKSKCDNDGCDKLCISECECGERYCSRQCQAADWANHRKVHQQVVENNELAMTLLKQYWSKRGVH